MYTFAILENNYCSGAGCVYTFWRENCIICLVTFKINFMLNKNVLFVMHFYFFFLLFFFVCI